MKKTICCTYVTERVIFQLAPAYFINRLTLNPTIKCCRPVYKHILRLWKNVYFWSNRTFSFWSLNTSKAPASFVPFKSNTALFAWWAHKSNVSFCSTRANSSFFTFLSLDSLRSRRPLFSPDALSCREAFRTMRASFPRCSFLSLVSRVPRGTFFSLESLLTCLTELISCITCLCKFIVDFLADLT